MIHDPALERAARQRVVDHAAGDRAFGQPADVLPAERDAGPLAVRRAQVVAGVAPDGLAGEADAGEALGGGEDDAAVGVVPGVGLVLAQDGELDAVDGQELVEVRPRAMAARMSISTRAWRRA